MCVNSAFAVGNRAVPMLISVPRILPSGALLPFGVLQIAMISQQRDIFSFIFGELCHIEFVLVISKLLVCENR